MKPVKRINAMLVAALALFVVATAPASAADQSLLKVLLENGVLTQEQYDTLLEKDTVTSNDTGTPAAVAAPTSQNATTQTVTLDDTVQAAIDASVAAKVEAESPVVASYGSKGFRLETRDGNFQTNLQWRAQLRWSDPGGGDPRQLADFGSDSEPDDFELRRLRMKIGGYGYKPWIKYYFEIDLQPSKDADADSSSSSARVIDYRIDLAKYEQIQLRLGQWKIDYNRERVDSSGKQEFVERSIVNRIFTVDRQVGLALRGRLFAGTPADLRYYAGIFNGEGRSSRNLTDDNMYLARLQWNFLGRDLPWTQTDVEFTEKPTASFAVAGVTTKGPCTRFSSSGCGNLDGFERVVTADPEQYKIKQAVQEFAFKYRGWSIQQEWHRKFITDRLNGNNQSDLTGFYAQSGYFFHNLFSFVPPPLQFAARYAYVKEPNENDLEIDNERREYTVAANWFFNGHRNKLTADYSYLTIDDDFERDDANENRVRVQWDVSF